PFRTPAIYYTNETANCFGISAIAWRDPQYRQRAACQSPTRSEKNSLSKCKGTPSSLYGTGPSDRPQATLTLVGSQPSSGDFATWRKRTFEAGVSCRIK